MITEDRLVDGLLRHERWAHNEMYRLFRKHFENFLKYKFGYIDSFLMEETINDSFLKIFNRIDQYSYTGTFKNWCLTIVERVYIQNARTRYKWMVDGEYVRKPTEQLTEELPDYAVDNYLESNIDIGIVMNLAMETLSCNDYDIIRRKMLGYTHVETAEYLGKTKDNVQKRFAKATHLLSQRLN